MFSKADVTIGAIDVPVEKAHRFGVLRVDSSQRVRDFLEKPQALGKEDAFSGKVVASMGIYVFNKDLLGEALEHDSKDSDSTHDFGRDILPRLIRQYDVCAHLFVDENKKVDSYWMDVGTIDAYYEANMDFVRAIRPRRGRKAYTG